MANPNYKRNRKTNTKLHMVRVPITPHRIKVSERYLKPLLHLSEEEKIEIFESIKLMKEEDYDE